MTEDTKKKVAESATLKYSVALGCGVIAGFAAAILSHVRQRVILYILRLIANSLLDRVARRYPPIADQQRPRPDGLYAPPTSCPGEGGWVEGSLCWTWPEDADDGWPGIVTVLDVRCDQGWYVV